ncbi:hypothetical protein PROFUN_08960 [Planoprotostelium fungivorum]|uniref:Uncharacterized protein n=1 Tax=Planoprotostelium fungivorum TaxID=1890364 RepID=A0A2P6NIR3_9EUKA|nr:hypothetical protein PROFUN_08960 [Planoprotostelium fungivorum]
MEIAKGRVEPDKGSTHATIIFINTWIALVIIWRVLSPHDSYLREQRDSPTPVSKPIDTLMQQKAFSELLNHSAFWSQMQDTFYDNIVLRPC